MLTGCAGLSSPPSAASGAERAAAASSPVRVDASTGPEVFVSTAAGSVDFYSARGRPVGSVAFHTSPGQTIYGGLAIDASKDLYVGVVKNVDVLPAPYKVQQATLDGSGQGFDGLAVDRQTGLVAGANFHCCQNSNIVIWKAGDATPCKRLSNDDTYGIFGVAFDAEHDLFVTAVDRDGAAHIFEVYGGCNAKGFQELSFSNHIANIGGIQINAADQPVVSDDSGNLFTYDRPSGGSLGAPIETTTVSDGFRKFALTADGKAVWIIGQTSVAEYSYPSGGSPIAYISKTEGAQEDIDIATAPLP